jgi:hypothetical protein
MVASLPIDFMIEFAKNSFIYCFAEIKNMASREFAATK